MSLVELLFWAAIGLLFYIFGGFGVLVATVGSLARRRVEKRDIEPSVSLVIAAYNEEAGIEAKIDNSLALDYPQDRLTILVGSDGSSDRTVDLARSAGGDRVRVLDLERRGKIFVLDELVRHSTDEILVFSDANTMYEPDAIRRLVRNFADPSVGGVCGNQKHRKSKDEDSSSAGEGLYWRYDKWLKRCESASGSIVAADGAMYAIRRELFDRPTTAAVTDDFFLSTAVVERGFRLVFEEEAVGFEPTTGKSDKEFRRKVRIMTRGLNGVLLRKRLLNPFKYGFYSWVLFSHKLLRRFASLYLLLALGTSLALAGQHWVYGAAAMSQLAFYSLAGLGFVFRKDSLGRKKILSTPFFFCLANAAALFAVGNLVRGHQIDRWEPAREGASV